MQDNSLKLNGEKTEVLILGNNKELWSPQHWPSEMWSFPQPTTQVRNLGIIVDDHLSMKQQAVSVASTCFAILKWLRKILWMLPSSTQRTVVQALITSRLDYGNILYLGANKDVIRRLQVVQNAAARLLGQIPRMASVSSTLCDLHWLRVENRVKFKALSYMFKVKSGSAPKYLKAIVHRYIPACSLRSSTQAKFIVPKIRLSQMGGRSFSYLGPSLWNSLPLSLRNETVFSNFRRHVKTWLFNQ